MHGLNPKQWEACSYTEGPLLILAGAGSGKTRVITHRIAYLIEEKDVNPYNILAITFTNKAAGEMRERVDKLVGMGAESIWVSTFHSMCVRILRRFADRIGADNHFTIYDADDQKTVVKEALKAAELDPKSYPEREMIKVISNAKEQFMDPDEYEKSAAFGFREKNIAKVYREYEKRMRKNKAFDFDDLILKTIVLFQTAPDVLEYYQERFRYIMVDEYQDTNHSQFLLISLLAKKYRNLCVVGDDDQSIYKFRGANIYNILNFEDTYPDAHVVRLEQNYRSTQRILDAANAVIKNNENRKAKRLWTENGEGDKLEFMSYDSEYDEADGITDIIQQELLAGKNYSDLAVLYRTNMQSRVIEEKMVMRGIPYVLVGGTGFYDRKEIRDIVAYLKVMDNPADDIALRRIINVPRRGIGDTTVDRLQDIAIAEGISMLDAAVSEVYTAKLGRSGGKVLEFGRMVDELRRTEGVTELFDALMEKTGYKLSLESENTDEAKTRLDNLDELRNKIVDYEEGSEMPSLTELLEEIALVSGSDDSEDDQDKVTLMTLHSAKGLEFPVVVMAGMEEGLFPSGISLDSDDPDAVEEERRLCYVGITRAMQKLYMTSAMYRMIRGSREPRQVSSFIEEIPSELIINHSAGRGFSRRSADDSLFYGDSFGGNSSCFGAGSGARSFGRGGSGNGSSRFGRGAGSGSFGSGNGSSGFGRGAGSGSFGSGNGSGRNRNAQSAASVYAPVKRGLSGGFTPSYGVGDTVKHIKFGKGTVKALEQQGTDWEVTVQFDSVGEKHMFASLAKLKKV